MSLATRASQTSSWPTFAFGCGRSTRSMDELPRSTRADADHRLSDPDPDVRQIWSPADHAIVRGCLHLCRLGLCACNDLWRLHGRTLHPRCCQRRVRRTSDPVRQRCLFPSRAREAHQLLYRRAMPRLGRSSPPLATCSRVARASGCFPTSSSPSGLRSSLRRSCCVQRRRLREKSRWWTGVPLRAPESRRWRETRASPWLERGSRLKQFQ